MAPAPCSGGQFAEFQPAFFGLFDAGDQISQIKAQLGHVGALLRHLLFQLPLLQLQVRQLLIESRKLLVFLEVSTPRTIALGFAAALRFW